LVQWHIASLPRRRSSDLFDGGARLAVRLAALEGLALVVLLLALGEAHRHFHAAVLEVEPHRHERHPLFDSLPDQLADFVAVEQRSAEHTTELQSPEQIVS